jgi:DNA-binding FadR family transcriptional regulator
MTDLVPQLVALNAEATEHLKDAARFTGIERRFHREISHGCGNHTMAVVMGSLDALWAGHVRHWAGQTTARKASPGIANRQAVLSVHIKLTHAIEAGDSARARLLAAHRLCDARAYVAPDDPGQGVTAVQPWRSNR